MLAQKIKAFYADKGGIKGKTLAMWGLAFKANTDDIRESAAIDIINELTEAGMKIQAYDPQAGKATRDLFPENSLLDIKSKQYDALHGADALSIVTDWNQFRNPDFDRIKNELNAPVVFDGRNLYAAQDLTDLGFSYFGVGRPR
jgi:UDPglucose 6-dehydrogenase